MTAHNPDEPRYLSADGVILVHARVFQIDTESARTRLLFPNKLASAVERPRMAAQYEAADFVRQAAYLVHGISEAQAFIEGNKRTAVIALEAFISINMMELTMSNEALFDLLIGIAHGLDIDAIDRALRPFIRWSFIHDLITSGLLRD